MMKDYDHRTERPVAWVIGAAQMWRADLRGRSGSTTASFRPTAARTSTGACACAAAGLEVRYVPDAEVMHVFQQATRRSPFGRKSLRALRDWYYLQWKHRSLRRDRRLLQANA